MSVHFSIELALPLELALEQVRHQTSAAATSGTAAGRYRGSSRREDRARNGLLADVTGDLRDGVERIPFEHFDPRHVTASFLPGTRPESFVHCSAGSVELARRGKECAGGGGGSRRSGKNHSPVGGGSVGSKARMRCT